ncbi:PQQ-binding-like beta-propeller repeat protein [Rubinisphaera sp.]|uniref:outer membrane protein assembly factor BamB family protein n=1 Tax=Rubinisphaera sp. TaxID=2024857 RepID=UPI000C10FD7D|nr:PQQ-binding-like beta-propeller repeat protein [Rubinisphaera sp.]MBV10087.1 serine/threonine protein kinase [Rubinisphaera sp.]|tara:strand:- start:13549 stop:15762 length:2214 start_codon:yes stop_codon:yes gene_type:complete
MKLTHLTGLTLCLVFATTLNAGDWAHWRGPEMNGISRETNLPERFDIKTGENVLWDSPIGGRSTPIVMNGRVYLNCRTDDDVADPVEKIHAREQVVCWDAETGEVLWKDVFNVFQTDIPAPRVGWASMVGDPETGNVYVHSVSGIFKCYDPDGNVLWQYSLFEEFGKISGYGGRTQTPIIDEDRIIVSFFCLNWGKTAVPPPKQSFYAFDKKTGVLQWVSAPGGPPLDTNYSCPIVTVIEGQRMLIAGNADGGIYSINARTGEPIWGAKLSKRGLNSSPVADGNLVYISNGEDNIDTIEFGRVQCFDASKTGDITESGSVWRVDDIKAGYASLLVKDGILYVVTDTGKLTAFDSKNGNILWEYSIGTVGKGSPVWADGKLYVMEVNGNIHILKPSREKCEKLYHTQLLATKGSGTDEIYASPAIANGRVYFCTRDRLLCIGKKDHEVTSDPVPELAAEDTGSEEIATLRLIPYEARVTGSGSIDYELRAYNKNGVFLKTLEFELTPDEKLSAAKAQGSKLVLEGADKEQAGLVTAKAGDLTTTARVRYFPEGDWKWDFEGYTEKQVPATWVNAFLKLKPTEVDGQTSMINSTNKGRPSVYMWLGPPEMTGYTMQADVLMKENRRQLPGIGLTVQRYNLILKGNYGKLAVQSWAPHLRMAKEVKFRSDPDVWYTMKCKVEIKDGEAHVLGKVWERDKEEPAEWTIEAVDPHPNENGSPGIYLYSMADSMIDNVSVTKE